MAYTINGEAADLAGPEDVGGVQFVPMAQVVEMLGGYVTWDNGTKTANIELGSTKADVQDDNDTATINGSSVTLLSRPSMGHGALWVPVDLFAALGCTVNAEGSDVSISNT